MLTEIDGEMVMDLPAGVRIEHEDVVVTSQRGLYYFDREVTLLFGDVKINQNTLTMWGDEGEYRKREDRLIMRRNVWVSDEGWEVTCDEARYNRATEYAWLVGNIEARDSVTTLYADSLFYDRNVEKTEAFGDVRITNEQEGFTAEGNHGLYYRDTGEAVIDRNPRLTVDPDSPEPVTIDSDTMRVFPDQKRALAYYKVKILKGNTVTQCDSAALFDEENRVELYGNPLAKQDLVSMKGLMMELTYNEEEVERIDIKGGAEIREEQPDTLVVGRENWIAGDSMSLYLRENSVDSILVINNAVSEYFPASPRKTESNFIKGDSMFFVFSQDSLDYVRVTGTAEGVYKFLDLGDEQTPDSLRAVYDSTLTYVSFPDKAQKVVYSAKWIEYYARTKDLILEKDAKIRYDERTLSGDQITYLSSLQLMDARGNPKLVDGGQEFFGSRMNYDMEAEAGVVNQGSTRFEQGFYKGENVAKVGDDEMKVWHSRYTTCDLKVPHFHIKAKYMKVYQKDKAVSGSTVLYIGETPIFYLPFIANSIRRGRRSGFLRPDFEFGITSSSGRFIRNVGYYWATSDYTDFNFIFDFNEDRSTRMNVRNRYKVRYKFDGTVSFDFYRDLNSYLNEWKIDARHSHTLGERFKFSSDLHFVSSDQANQAIERIDDVERVVDRQIRSNMSLSKNWDQMGITVSANRTQKLNVTDPNVIRISETLPSLRFSIPSRDLYFGERNPERARGAWEKILSNVKYSPSVSGQRQKKVRSTQTFVDSVSSDADYMTEETYTATASLGFTSPQKIGFVTLSPTFNLNDNYTYTVWDTFATQVDDTTFIDPNRVVEDENVFRWSFGANSSTKFYGTFYPRIGSLRGIRHVVTPTVRYSFNPKTRSRPRAQSFSVSLTNAFDLKVLQKSPEGRESGGGNTVTNTSRDGTGRTRTGPPDSVEDGAAGEEMTEEEKLRKISGFLIWTLSSSYNPEAPREQGWSNVNSTVNLRAFGTSLSLNQSFEPYERNLLSTSIQTGFTIRGSHPFGRSDAVKVQELNVVASSDTTAGKTDDTARDLFGGEVVPGETPAQLQLEEGRLPWDLSVVFGYNKTRGNEPRATAQTTGRFDLTKHWRFTYGVSYDIQAREIRGQNFGVHRDLHCWEMSLSRQQIGDEWQFYFRIAIKAHPEIYGETGQRGLGGFAGGITSGMTGGYR
jgi:lipopolysaccharide assembly outer membrane protein LptD (OstA)